MSLLKKYMDILEASDPNYMYSDDPKVYQKGRDEEMRNRKNTQSPNQTPATVNPAKKIADGYVASLKMLEGDAKTPKVEEAIMAMIKHGASYQDIRRVLQGSFQNEAGLDVMKQQEYLNYAKVQGAK